MRSPFDSLGSSRIKSTQEDVEGQFDCQTRGCYETAREAKYLIEQKVLTWICRNGHISKAEDFRLD